MITFKETLWYLVIIESLLSLLDTSFAQIPHEREAL